MSERWESEMWYWESEFAVSDEHEPMGIEVCSPVITMETHLGRFALEQHNTAVYYFPEPYDFMDHIYHKPDHLPVPVFMFDMPVELTDHLYEEDYRYIFTPHPTPLDLEAYYDYARGHDPIEIVAKRILGGDSNG